MSVLHHLAHAKINLTLHLTGKRYDGYHLLESLMSFATLHDIVTVEKADTLQLVISGPFATALSHDKDQNILLKTAMLLAEKAGIQPNVHITLHKAIPIGAGIGGGSADAAALLHLLYRLWELSFTAKEMQELALQIGADVPVCYGQETALVSGIGERISPLPFPFHIPAVLINPLQSLSTIAVFKQGVTHFSTAENHQHIPTELNEFIHWMATKNNDLQPAAIQLMPVISDIITALKNQQNCLLARMSGSGATCFGLFKTEKEASEAANTLRKNHPNWWIQETIIGNPPHLTETSHYAL